MKSYKKSIINVYITMPAVSYITSEGVGKIQSTDTLVADTLQLETKSAGDIDVLVRTNNVFTHLFGSGDLTINGSTGKFLCNFFGGTGFLYADKLNTGYTYLSSSTTGDCFVTSKGQLDVTIYRNGNVYYNGNPSPINYKTYGKGQLYKQ